MKGRRQEYLLQLIKTKDIETQEELMGYLHDAGFVVTKPPFPGISGAETGQGTDGKGGYKYALPQGTVKGDLNRRARRVFEDYVRGIDFSGNILVVKTYPGGANAVAAVLDELE